MDILITGVSGLVGGNLAHEYLGKYNIAGTYSQNKVNIKPCDVFRLDLTKKSEVDSVKKRFDAVIHCAGPTNLDYCEQNRNYAYDNIFKATENALSLAKRHGSFFIFMSTNAVFDGKNGHYSEKDTPNPTNYYGELKLQCERMVGEYENHCILRIIPYGWNILNKTSIAEWVLLSLRERKNINGFTDAIFSPILVNNMAEAIEEIFTKRVTGTFHLGGSDSCSKYDFAVMIAELAGLDKSLIKPASAEEFFKAKRGHKLDLNISRISKAVDTQILGTKEGLKRFLELEKRGYAKRLKAALDS
ncbi:SDR family oxidoreductase [Candidatus Woesearchaeota archaeon]|nr:SDR family oxidoreductase [Candidatus Woesearchaeota archaeon]